MPHPFLDDTIAALASAAGPGARGIIRISGSDCRAVLDRVVEWSARADSLRGSQAHVHNALICVAGDVKLPAIVYLWPGTRSYTGQPLAEIHTTSSPPLVEAVLMRAYESGARPARPGEFTLRAFLNGRLDLTQAEAVLGVIDAHDQPALERALRQLGGGISGPLAEVRHDLMNLLADLEAGLDFVEDDVTFVSSNELIKRITAARTVCERLLQQSTQRAQSTGRHRVALAGLPNAGKSTLFNALLNREAAIVSDVSGTTRDFLTVTADWNGVQIELIDTPGRDGAKALIAGEAQRLALAQIDDVELVIWCSSADYDANDVRIDEQLFVSLVESGHALLRIATKRDLARSRSAMPGIAVCAISGEGLDALRRAVLERLCETNAGSELLGTTAARCHGSLLRTLAALDRALSSANDAGREEFVALELREALEAIGEILGAVYTDDILDRIFSRFCIGK